MDRQSGTGTHSRLAIRIEVNQNIGVIPAKSLTSPAHGDGVKQDSIIESLDTQVIEKLDNDLEYLQ